MLLIMEKCRLSSRSKKCDESRLGYKKYTKEARKSQGFRAVWIYYVFVTISPAFRRILCRALSTDLGDLSMAEAMDR